VYQEVGISLLGFDNAPDLASYKGVLHVVAHAEFHSLPLDTNKDRLVIFDVKGTLGSFTDRLFS
jgi:hypothetical protein